MELLFPIFVVLLVLKLSLFPIIPWFAVFLPLLIFPIVIALVFVVGLLVVAFRSWR